MRGEFGGTTAAVTSGGTAHDHQLRIVGVASGATGSVVNREPEGGRGERRPE